MHSALAEFLRFHFSIYKRQSGPKVVFALSAGANFSLQADPWLFTKTSSTGKAQSSLRLNSVWTEHTALTQILLSSREINYNRLFDVRNRRWFAPFDIWLLFFSCLLPHSFNKTTEPSGGWKLKAKCNQEEADGRLFRPVVITVASKLDCYGWWWAAISEWVSCTFVLWWYHWLHL